MPADVHGWTNVAPAIRSFAGGKLGSSGQSVVVDGCVNIPGCVCNVNILVVSVLERF